MWPPESLGRALAAVDSVLSALDRQASRFRPDSEISWIHRAGGGLFMLSDGLAEAISVALAAARWTGGLADPTVGDALISLGYDRDFAAIDPEPAVTRRRASPAPGWQTVRLDGPMLRLPAGVRLDLGATAKGLGSDRAVRAAMAASGQAGGVLVSLGGDIAVAGQPPRDGWPILVADGQTRPRSPRRAAGPAGQRRGRDLIGHLPPVAAGGQVLHHIVDPADRAARRRAMADGQRGRGHLCRRQRRRHRGDRRRRRGRGMAGHGGPAGPARRPRRRECAASAAGRGPTAAACAVPPAAMCTAGRAARRQDRPMSAAAAWPGPRACGSSRGPAGWRCWSCSASSWCWAWPRGWARPAGAGRGSCSPELHRTLALFSVAFLGAARR